MYCGVAIALIIHAQPVCSQKQFQESMRGVLQGEHEIVAMAIFDDYVDQAKDFSRHVPDERSSPLQRIQLKKDKAIQAATLFDELLSSLAVVSQSRSWNIATVHLRRTVLLATRQYQNPWRSVVWADIPKDEQQDNEVVLEINRFLQTNADQDRRDRFDAKIALLKGDFSLCKLIENRVMHRWVEYQKLVGVIDGLEFEKKMFPLLDQGVMIHNIVVWISEHVDDDTLIAEAMKQFKAWGQLSWQQKNTYKKLVTVTREDFGVDPVSTGCGVHSMSVSRVKNRLLQLTGEMQELNSQAEQKILQLLSQEQREKVSFTGKMFTDDVLPITQ